jgi:hypothetical protein
VSEPSVIAQSHADDQHWRWVRWLLGSTALACAVVISFNWAIDPTGKLGTGLLDPVSRLARDRTAKVQLLEAAPHSELVVLGSSRTKQLDPRELDRSARDPRNAAFVGGDLFEARVVTAWLAERADAGDADFPHLVVGVDVEGFRGRSLRGSGLLGVDQLRSIARREAGSPSRLELAPDAGDLLLSMETTRASWRTMRLQLRQRDRQRLRLEDETRGVDDFDAVGMPLETRAWLDDSKVPALTRRTRGEIDPSIGRYRANYVEQGAKLDPASEADLERLVRIATAHGDRPVVFITPAHERFARALDPIGRATRHARLVTLLRRLAGEQHVTWIDCSDCVPSVDRYWLDGAHTSPLGSSVLAQALRDRIG